MLLSGCFYNPSGHADAVDETSTGGTASSGSPATGESVSTAPSTTTTENAPTTGVMTVDPSPAGSITDATAPGTFTLDPDGGSGGCDMFTQDCPDGQKCAAWADDGGATWTANKCVPVVGDGIPGDACTAEGGPVSGFDSCEKGSMCWNVDQENVGTCLALCTGSIVAPVCAEGFACTVIQEGVLHICSPTCDPLIQDCSSGELCLPHDNSASCVLDASGEEGQIFDPCELVNGCDPGLLCLESASADECDPMAPGCCVPMCSIFEMAPCPGVGQECVSLYDEGQAPMGLEYLGQCTALK